MKYNQTTIKINQSDRLFVDHSIDHLEKVYDVTIEKCDDNYIITGDELSIRYLLAEYYTDEEITDLIETEYNK